jgi:hypothetical protein
VATMTSACLLLYDRLARTGDYMTVIDFRSDICRGVGGVANRGR